MIMENDEFVIPEQYRKMSVTELDAEANKMLKEIQQLKIRYMLHRERMK